jgi:cation diffusion facilitator CzcD-associated flavoprotein CzcO
MKGSPEQIGATAVFTENMKKRLEAKPSLIPKLMPSFPPVCRRLTPGPGYLEALSSDKCEVVSTPILRVEETGIRTTDGRNRPVDALVCATGFDTSFSPRFPIIGRRGVTLAEKWRETPKTYIAIATDDFPNYFISLGPNAALGTGNLLLLIEKELDYFTACAVKMQRDNIKSMVPRREAVETFVQYCDAYFEKTVFSMKCRSWYKGGKEDGRVNALWPGTSSGVSQAQQLLLEHMLTIVHFRIISTFDASIRKSKVGGL